MIWTNFILMMPYVDFVFDVSISSIGVQIWGLGNSGIVYDTKQTQISKPSQMHGKVGSEIRFLKTRCK